MNLPAAPAWTLKGNKTFNDLDGNAFGPGPSYNLSGMGAKTKSVSYTTGKSKRSQINHGVLSNPAPTQYNPKDPNIHTNQITIPKDSKIKEKAKEDDPDPATYDSKFNFIKEKISNFTIGSKYPSIMDDINNNPGPGYYNNPQSKFSSTLSSKYSKFGTQTRFYNPNKGTPGPSDYQPYSQFGTNNKKGGMPQSGRYLGSKKNVPGPGTYQHFDPTDYNIKNNTGKTLGKKFEGCLTGKSQTTEAFNNYFKNGEGKQKVKSYTLGKETRDKLFSIQNNPGPSDYNPNPNHTFKDSNSTSFPKGSFKQINQAVYNPGPGQYQEKKFKSTKYTIGKSKSVDYINTNPGVGRYNTDLGFLGNRTGNLIGKSNRTNFITKNIAGVGDYDLIAHKTSGVTIPRANRFPKQNTNPGPGAYHMHSTISNFNFYRKRG